MGKNCFAFVKLNILIDEVMRTIAYTGIQNYQLRWPDSRITIPRIVLTPLHTDDEAS